MRRRFLSMLRAEFKGLSELVASRQDIKDWWTSAGNDAIDEGVGARLSDSSIGSSAADSVATMPLTAAAPSPHAELVEAQAAAVGKGSVEAMMTARFEALEAKVAGLAAKNKALEGRVAAAEAEAAAANIKAEVAQAEAAVAKAQVAALLKAPLPMPGTVAEADMPLPVPAAAEMAKAADQLALIVMASPSSSYSRFSEFNGREQALLWAVANGVKLFLDPVFERVAALEHANSWTVSWIQRLMYDVNILIERANATYEDLNILRAESTTNLATLRDELHHEITTQHASVKNVINRVINAVTANHARMDVLDEQVRGLALGLDQLELMVAGPTGGGVAEGLEGDDGVAADAQP